jgi:hypothetical protein
VACQCQTMPGCVATGSGTMYYRPDRGVLTALSGEYPDPIGPFFAQTWEPISACATCTTHKIQVRFHSFGFMCSIGRNGEGGKFVGLSLDRSMICQVQTAVHGPERTLEGNR